MGEHHQEHTHDHHGHNHGAVVKLSNIGTAFVTGIVLNLVYVIVQVIIWLYPCSPTNFISQNPPVHILTATRNLQS